MRKDIKQVIKKQPENTTQTKMHNKNWVSFIFVTFGWLFTTLYFYTIFLRERLPKNIPSNLIEFTFYTFLFICFIYLFIIKHYIKNKPPGVFVFKIISYISIPFVFFDAFLKHNKYFYPYYYKLLCFIIKNLKYNMLYYDNIIFYFIFNIIPRIILLLLFIVDVFLLNKIYIFLFLHTFNDNSSNI